MKKPDNNHTDAFQDEQVHSSGSNQNRGAGSEERMPPPPPPPNDKSSHTSSSFDQDSKARDRSRSTTFAAPASEQGVEAPQLEYKIPRIITPGEEFKIAYTLHHGDNVWLQFAEEKRPRDLKYMSGTLTFEGIAREVSLHFKGFSDGKVYVFPPIELVPTPPPYNFPEGYMGFIQDTICHCEVHSEMEGV